ncbi:MAG: YjjG family noncanonical pyrimidine nucleotidase [Acutalibacteraceae bacterium]
MERKYTTLLMDADDTLLDFAADENAAFFRVMKQYGVPMSQESAEIYRQINLSLWKALERGEITKPELKQTRFRLFFDAIGYDFQGDCLEFNERYLGFLGEGGRLMEGARETLDELNKRSYDIYIVTNGVAATQRKRLERSGLIGLIHDIFVSDAVGAPKPKKEFFNFVLSRLPEKDKSKILVVGDSLTSDIRGAMNADLDSVWVNHKKEALPSAFAPTVTVGEISDLLGLLP